MKKEISGWVVAIAVMLALPGCLTQKKAERQLANINTAFPGLIAGNCHQLFPVVAKPGIPEYKPANNVDWSDSLNSMHGQLFDLQKALDDARLEAAKIPGCEKVVAGLQGKVDSLIIVINKMRREYVPCAPDTITRVDTVPDLAAIASLDAQISNLTKVVASITGERDKYKLEASEQRKRANGWIWKFWALVAGAGLYIFRKPLLRIITKVPV